MHKIQFWPTAPIVFPRWMLTVKYGMFVILGIAVTLTTQPTLRELTDDTFTAGWAIGIMAFGALAALGSLSEQLEPMERWGGVGLCSLLVVYALSPIAFIIGGDFDRLSYSVIAIMVTGVPAVRTLSLLRTTGKTHDDDELGGGHD